MNPLDKYIIIGLGLLLGISAGANLVLTHLWVAAREDKAVAVEDRDTARTLAKSCSDGVDALTKQAEQRATDATKERDAATAAAKLATTKAANLLKTQPKFVGDDCKSASAQVDDWLASRAPAGSKP